jgi:multiple sugar transport system permease protein
MVAVAYVWKWLYNPSYGLINQALAAVHLPTQLWLESNVLVLPSLAVIYLWARFGFDMLIFIAGLEGIPVAYYEAARIDGAGKGRALWHITLPLLNPQFVLVGILDTIGALNIFDLPYAATAGGPGDASRTAVMYLYDTAFTFFNFGKSAVSTLVLFVLITALTLVQRRLVARHVEY